MIASNKLPTNILSLSQGTHFVTQAKAKGSMRSQLLTWKCVFSQMLDPTLV